MVTLPGGTFTMGDTISASPPAIVAPHRVTVSSFAISRTEITQGQWAAVMGFFWGGSEDNLAAGNMTFYDAVAFCNAKSEQDGLQPAYIIDGDGVHWDRAAAGYRLPTEAEWEYAARGGPGHENLPYPGSADLEAVAWHYDNTGGNVQLVAQKQPNQFGLYDMSGNVSEWCWDYYDDYHDGGPPTLAVDPFGPVWGADYEHVIPTIGSTARITRGGSESSPPSSGFAVYGGRGPSDPGRKHGGTGFRVVRSVATPANLASAPIVPPILSSAEGTASAPPAAPAGMVYIFGGVFQRGTQRPVPGTSASSSPEHTATVRSFFVGRTEVTRAEYNEFLVATSHDPLPGGERAANYPVTMVSWFDAVAYCNWRSEQEGLEPYYFSDRGLWRRNVDTDGYRLPTEAEWEYVAGVGTPGVMVGVYSTEPPPTPRRDWSEDNSRGLPHEVATSTPDDLGLYDLHGNVSEWCWDSAMSFWGLTFAVDPAAQYYSANPAVVRGGSFRDEFDSFWIVRRVRLARSESDPTVGFRVARSTPRPGEQAAD